MKRLVAVFGILALPAVAVHSPAEPVKKPPYSSEKPLYTRVALNGDGSKVLTVVFDESRGTGKRYDVLYADVDLSGRLDEAKRFEARTSTCPAGVRFHFPPIELNVPYKRGAVGISDPWKVTFSREKHLSPAPRLLRSSSLVTNLVPRENFFLLTSIKLRVGSAERQYSFKRSIKPSQSLNDAPVWTFPRSPKIAIIAKPDEERKGNLGIGLDLADAEGQKQVTAGIQLQGSGCGCPPMWRSKRSMARSYIEARQRWTSSPSGETERAGIPCGYRRELTSLKRVSTRVLWLA